jgi:hypothetical protein
VNYDVTALLTSNVCLLMCLPSCIFLPSNGSFFVNYVITAALIGTALELLRFTELFMYGLKLMMARSSAEKAAVQKVRLMEEEEDCEEEDGGRR